MAHYTSAHPALPQLTSGEDDGAAEAIAEGAPLDPGDCDAARHQKKRRILLQEKGLASEDEVHASAMREFQILSDHACGANVPPWARNMEILLQNIQRDIGKKFDNLENNMNARFDAVEAKVSKVEARLDNVEARQVNLGAYEPDHRIQPLRNTNGQVPQDFPENVLEYDNLTDTQVNRLVKFYGLPNTPQPTKRRRLMRFLGIRRG